MQAIDVIRLALEQNERDLQLIEDMRDAPLTQPTPRGGNHPLWVLGHIALSEAALRQGAVGGANELEHWNGTFAGGTEPTANPDDYPPFDEVLAAYHDQRATTLRVLEEIGDDGLGQPPKHRPEGMEEFFRTVADCFLVMAYHVTFHTGQVADARRVAGRRPVFF
jgi:hypothetical protein